MKKLRVLLITDDDLVPPEDYERVRDELIERIEGITDMDGRKLDTYVFKPEQVYGMRRGDYPDLMVFLDDLYWRAAGTVGHPSMYLRENDTGPDDANHAKNGIFILTLPHKGKAQDKRGYHIMDIAPTILDWFGLDVPV